MTSLSEGSLYIDVDTDIRSVVSLNGEEDITKEYMLSTGMMSSLYESTVWEELTGYESVSTISILAKAQEENVDILLISAANLNTEIEKLNTDETTKQSVILLCLTCIAMVMVVDRYIEWELDFLDFLMNDDVDAAFDMMYEFANDVGTDAKITAVFGSILAVLRYTEWKYDINIGTEINKLLRKLTSQKIQNIINKYGFTVEEFADLL